MRGYLEGVSLAAFARGNRRILAPLKARHAEASTDHAAALVDLRARRAKAMALKDPTERAKALEELGERPLHPTLVAAGCAVVAAVVGWPMLHGHAGAVVAGGLTLWVIVALIAGQEQPEAAVEDAEEFDGEEPPATVPTPADAHRVTASRTAAGTSVLLTRLAADLAAQHPDWDPSTKAVRALLAEAGIRVREGVRTPGGNGPGVHHEDAPAPLPSPGAAPEAGVVANVGAGQSTNANANNVEEWVGSAGFIMRAHSDDPARTTILGRTDAA